VISLRKLFPVVVLPLALMTCSDDEVTSPGPNPIVTITPAMQWSGGRILVSGAGVADAASVVLVDGEPVDATVMAGDTVAITLPNPRLTGTATVEVFRNDLRVAVGSVEVVGSAWPVRIVECLSGVCQSLIRLEAASPLYYHGVSAGAGRFFAFFQTQGGIVAGIAGLDNPEPELTPIPGLAADEFPGLVAPGPTMNAKRWIIDLSGRNVSALPDIWEVNPNPIEIRPLGCLGTGMSGGYAVAELPTGDCLVLSYALAGPGTFAALSVNGSSPIPGYDQIPWGWTAGCASFRASAGNERIALRSLNGSHFCRDASNAGLPAWPVFAADGSLAFSNTRYADWPKGVSFSPDGRTMWTVGESAGWTLDTWDVESGELLREFPLPGFTRCEDVMLDPVGPRVFVSCWREDREFPNDRWPALIVYDSEQSMIEAVIDTENGIVGSFFGGEPPFELVPGGSSGQVHLVAVWDGTNAAFDRGIVVASYDTF